MNNHSQQPQELNSNVKSSSCEVKEGGFSPTETSAITNGSVEDSQLNSSLPSADAVRNIGVVRK